jgi:hypothetical protein
MPQSLSVPRSHACDRGALLELPVPSVGSISNRSKLGRFHWDL